MTFTGLWLEGVAADHITVATLPEVAAAEEEGVDGGVAAEATAIC